MNNAEKFKQIFGLYATELWSMPEGDFLAWLNRDVETTQIDHTADIGKKVSISCGQENDLISRQAAIDAFGLSEKTRKYGGDHSGYDTRMLYEIQGTLENLPAVQPDRDTVDDCLYHIYKNISVHTATGGVIAIRYYMEKLYEEIYGKGERPWWMT